MVPIKTIKISRFYKFISLYFLVFSMMIGCSTSKPVISDYCTTEIISLIDPPSENSYEILKDWRNTIKIEDKGNNKSRIEMEKLKLFYEGSTNFEAYKLENRGVSYLILKGKAVGAPGRYQYFNNWLIFDYDKFEVITEKISVFYAPQVFYFDKNGNLNFVNVYYDIDKTDTNSGLSSLYLKISLEEINQNTRNLPTENSKNYKEIICEDPNFFKNILR